MRLFVLFVVLIRSPSEEKDPASCSLQIRSVAAFLKYISQHETSQAVHSTIIRHWVRAILCHAKKRFARAPIDAPDVVKIFLIVLSQRHVDFVSILRDEQTSIIIIGHESSANLSFSQDIKQ